MIFTNKNILYFLKYLDKSENKSGSHLLNVIEKHLSMDRAAAGTFLNQLDKTYGYVGYTPGAEYYIKPTGEKFIKRGNRKVLYKKIMFWVIPIIALIVTIIGVL